MSNANRFKTVKEYLNWDGLMKMAEKKSVRFMSVMSCTNGKDPCGMGLWEGVPLREVIWLARPTSNIRRICNKSVKWLQCIMLTNNHQTNDTYALWNNDTVSHIKTCARSIHTPKTIKAGETVPVTGVAQVGMSNLSKVQYWICRHDQSLPDEDPYFTKAPWQDADILPPPDHWGGGLPDDKLPPIPRQFDTITGKPLRWPMSNPCHILSENQVITIYNK